MERKRGTVVDGGHQQKWRGAVTKGTVRNKRALRDGGTVRNGKALSEKERIGKKWKGKSEKRGTVTK